MPFHGVLPQRQYIFTAATPHADIAVSDAAAWRLYPRHRWIYNKLDLALSQSQPAAPTGVKPRDLGIADKTCVFVRPMLNLLGMAIGAQAMQADQVPETPGYMWSTCLEGEQSSTDCLVQRGRARWFAHTVAGEKTARGGPPAYWCIGVAYPQNETLLAKWIAQNLPDYTGICNFEVIDGVIIEAHLRGSNGFFDFYGEGFIPAWVALVDHNQWLTLPPPPGGYVFSLFAECDEPIHVADATLAALSSASVSIQLDLDDNRRPRAGRIAIIRSQTHATGAAVREQLRQALQ